MRIIKNIDKTFFSLYNYQIIENKEYVDSKYIYYHEFNDKNLIFNFLTQEFIECNKNENLTEKFKIQHWFKFPKELDQFSFVYAFKQHKINKLQYQPNGIRKNIVLFTTTDCNARCYYCFENGVEKIRMQDNTASDVADFLIEKGYEYDINWFGGEPLFNSKCIDIITDKLRKANIYFKSDITTNGYLLDKFSIYKLKYKWNVTTIQITLDGTKDIYNKTKNYIHKDENPFERVLNNIFTVSSNKIFTKIRYNLSTENVDDIKKLISEISNSEKFNPYIHMYSNRLIREENYNLEDEYYLCDSEHAVNKYILDTLGNPNTNALFLKYKDYYCLADSGNCWVINPKGQLGRCEHYAEINQLNDIYNPIVNTNEIEKFTKQRYVDKCKECPLFPNCTLADICEGLLPCDEVGTKYYLDSCKVSLENILDNYNKNEDNDIKIEVY